MKTMCITGQFSCRDWWIPRHDPGREHHGPTAGHKQTQANFVQKVVDVLRIITLISSLN